MKQNSLILKTLIMILGVLGVYYLIRFPQAEGRATGLDLISIYKDPLVIYMYIASIPFFVMLYEVFKILGSYEKNKLSSKVSVSALRDIKYCAIAIIGFILGGLVYIRFFVHGDDPAGPTMIGFLTSIAFAIVAATARHFERKFS